MKKIFALMIFALMIFALLTAFVLPANAMALDLQIKGKSCLLADANTGEVLYSQEADTVWYPASVTKLMTLTLALEAVREGRCTIDDIVTTSEEAAAMGGSQVFLFAGEQRSLKEMLIGIAVGSGNDAAYAVAEFIGGSYEGFIQMMNEKAKELGMNNTNFVNPHGLYDADHYTSVADLAILARYALDNTPITDYTSVYEYKFRPEPKPLILWNTNRLLKWYAGTFGLKTGFTKESGYNLVSCAERNGVRLIGVVMGVTERNGHFSESMKLLNYGFNNWEFVTVYESGAEIAKVPIERGEQDEITVIIPQKAGVLQKKGSESEITARLILEEGLCAPIALGEQVGRLLLIKDGEELGEYPLLASGNVEKIKFGTIWKHILKEISFAS